jgi:DNA primase
VERLKAQETEAIEAARRDPSALVRYREIQARRRQLELAGERADSAAQVP